ncbi:MAG: hypothetical protein CMJ48_12425 [Planctomycetaceae bacterium]|nr:hypothetical protein [Planctomycetaceae bacterium]
MMLKRTFDVTAALVGILFVSPILLAISLRIKLGSKGPLFYRGLRVGRFGKPFRIYKFRTMVVDAEKIGGSSTSDDDPRITPVGKFLRKYKLDELPQLINVFDGTMSLVGPRPEVQQYVDLYSEEEQAILQIRPGITDWASIWNSDEGALLAGSDDPDKAYEELIRPTKLRLQLFYADNHSVLGDVKIILCTLRTLVADDFVPREVQTVVDSLEESAKKGSDPFSSDFSSDDASEFGSVTELPGMGATKEQLSMLHTRYRMAAELAEGKDVLELACGPGFGLGALEAKSHRVVGGDFDQNMVDIAARHYRDRVDVRRIDAGSLPFEDASFGVILLFEAIYFLPDAKAFVAEAHRVLRPDGRVMICSANRERPDFNAAPQTHKYYSAGELHALLCEGGFETELFAGYAVGEPGLAGRIRDLVRRVAVALHLIPKSMAWKTRIKRLVFGSLDPLPGELVVDESVCESVIRIDADQPAPEHKVIYAIGRRAA